MPKFVIEGETAEQPLAVSLSEDGTDVDIRVNGVFVAFFSGAQGQLELMECAEVERDKLSGVKFDDDGYIEVGR